MIIGSDKIMDPRSPEDRTPLRVSVFGSTGSVGSNTVSLLESNRTKYQVKVLTAGSNISLLAKQARRLNPEIVIIEDQSLYRDLKRELSGLNIEVAAGKGSITDAASSFPADWVMASIVGMAGLAPTLAAIRQGGIVALANKECLVSAGLLFNQEVRKYGAQLIPVDSEHNGIFQVFDLDRPETVENIILTASGGPFRTFSIEDMSRVTPEQAIMHPNWKMGKKISVDSATMMNKGLERIEAFYLFPIEKDQIDIVVHPQSIVHSMVTYRDGSVLAQLGLPDMRMPIAHALAWPNRIPVDKNQLDLCAIGQLTFEPPSENRFPALRLAREALESGSCFPAIMNAANEIAVKGFLDGRINFLDIIEVVEKTMCTFQSRDVGTIEEICEIDGKSRKIAEKFLRE